MRNVFAGLRAEAGTVPAHQGGRAKASPLARSLGGREKQKRYAFSFCGGASLLEMVLYVGIFAIITLLTVNTVLALTRAVGEIRSVRHIIRDSDIAMERMIREIRAAQTVDATASVLNTHPGKLVLTGTSSTITFSLLGGEQLFLKKNTGSPASPTSQGGPASLTSSSTRITNLVFTHLMASSSEAVRVRMTMNNKNFYGTAVLRGSYK